MASHSELLPRGGYSRRRVHPSFLPAIMHLPLSKGCGAILPLLLFYGAFASFIFWPLLNSPGAIAGGDWAMPVTPTQWRILGERAFFTWTNTFSLFGAPQLQLADAPLLIPLAVLGSWHVASPWLAKLAIVAIVIMSGLATALYCRYLGCSLPAAGLAGLALITSPPFFNYIVMGWWLVLWAITFLPLSYLALDCATRHVRLLPAIIAGALLAAATQPQAFVWIPLVWVGYISTTYIERGWRAGSAAVRAALIAIFSAAVFSSPFLMPVLWNSSSFVSGSAAATDVPLGQWVSSFNLLRLWGSLFNRPFEVASVSTSPLMQWTGFCWALLVFSRLALGSRDRRITIHVLVALIPFLLWKLHPLLHHVPYTAFLRDPARHIIVAAFAYSVLLGIILDRESGKFLSRVSAWRRMVSFCFMLSALVIVASNSLPFINGSLYAEPSIGPDIRLRTYNFDPAYSASEQWLLEHNSTEKALYIPIGVHLGSLSNQRFFGLYHELFNIFDMYSPLPGAIFLGDRMESPSASNIRALLTHAIEKPQGSVSVSRLLGFAGIRYIVARRDLYFGAPDSTDAEIAFLLSDANLEVTFQHGPVLILKNADTVPRVYAATISNLRRLGSTDAELLAALADPTYVPGVTVFMQDGGALPAARAAVLPMLESAIVKDAQAGQPIVTFRQRDPTTFLVQVQRAAQPFMLVLGESFDPGWSVYVTPGAPRAEPGGTPVASGPRRGSSLRSEGLAMVTPLGIRHLVRHRLSDTYHFQVNAYANGWYVDPKQFGVEDLSIVIFYTPQAFYSLALWCWLIAVVLLVLLVSKRLIYG